MKMGWWKCELPLPSASSHVHYWRRKQKKNTKTRNLFQQFTFLWYLLTKCYVSCTFFWRWWRRRKKEGRSKKKTWLFNYTNYLRWFYKYKIIHQEGLGVLLGNEDVLWEEKKKIEEWRWKLNYNCFVTVVQKISRLPHSSLPNAPTNLSTLIFAVSH